MQKTAPFQYSLKPCSQCVIATFCQHPYGMLMDGRSYTSSDYRYSFNGMEKITEINSNGSSLDFGARIYDGRIGRWMSVDVLQQKYSSFSPYNFVGNNPIIYIDPDGKEIKIPLWLSSIFEPEEVTSARRFARAIGGRFNKFSKKESKRLGYRAQVSIFQTETFFYTALHAGMQVACDQIFFLKDDVTSKGFGDLYESLGWYYFKTGVDYSYLFKPVQVLYANPAIAISIEEGAAFLLSEVVVTSLMAYDGLAKGDKSISLISSLNLATLKIESFKKEANGSAKGDRVETGNEVEAAENQLEGISKAQEKAKKEKKGEKQNKIRSIDKSKQRLKNTLRNIKNLDDL